MSLTNVQIQRERKTLAEATAVGGAKQLQYTQHCIINDDDTMIYRGVEGFGGGFHRVLSTYDTSSIPDYAIPYPSSNTMMFSNKYLIGRWSILGGSKTAYSINIDDATHGMGGGFFALNDSANGHIYAGIGMASGGSGAAYLVDHNIAFGFTHTFEGDVVLSTGSINLPSGHTYKINGSPHIHNSAEISGLTADYLLYGSSGGGITQSPNLVFDQVNASSLTVSHTIRSFLKASSGSYDSYLRSDASGYNLLQLGAEAISFSNGGNYFTVSTGMNIPTGKEYLVNGSQHEHSGSNITSGTVGYARLGSGGSGAGTKYLADDNTWKTIAAGSTTLAGLTDVSIATLTDAQILRYQTSDSKWHNWTPTFVNTITMSDDVSGGGSGSSATISATVNGIKGRLLPSLSDGFLKWNASGNAWVFDSSTYLTSNQSITWTASGDVSGTASGTTSISPSLTVSGIKGNAVPTLSAGYLNWTGSAWAFSTPSSTSPAGSDTWIQFNNSGAFGANTKLKYDYTNSVFYAPVMQLDIAATEPTGEGKVWWDSTNHCLAYNTDITGVSNQIGQEYYYAGRVKNTSGATIPNGSLVYVTGASGGNPTIALAKADAQATSRVVGMVTADIANNGFGYVTGMGVCHDLNTIGFTAGDIIYLSATTAGAWTSTPPAYPNVAIKVGRVTMISAGAGEVVINIGPAWSDTASFNILRATSLTVGGNAVVTGAAGLTSQIQFNNGGSFAGSSNFTWDNATSTLNATQALFNGGSTEPIHLRYQSTTVGSQVGICFELLDINGDPQCYGDIFAEIVSNTAGSTSGALVLKTDVSGVSTEHIRAQGGKVGIGRTPTTNALEVNGSIECITSSNSNVFSTTTSSTAYNYARMMNSTGTSDLQIITWTAATTGTDSGLVLNRSGTTFIKANGGMLALGTVGAYDVAICSSGTRYGHLLPTGQWGFGATAVTTSALTLPTSTSAQSSLNIGSFGVTVSAPVDGDIWKSAADSLAIRMNTNTRTIAFLEKAQTFSGNQTVSGTMSASNARGISLTGTGVCTTAGDFGYQSSATKTYSGYKNAVCYFDTTIASMYASITAIANTTSETTLLSGTKLGTLTMFAPLAGNSFRIRASGTVAYSSTQTLTIKMKQGTNVLCTITTSSGTLASSQWFFEGHWSVTTTTTAAVMGKLTIVTTQGTPVVYLVTSAGVTISNSALAFDLTATHSVANAGNTIQSYQATYEQLS